MSRGVRGLNHIDFDKKKNIQSDLFGFVFLPSNQFNFKIKFNPIQSD